MHTITFSLTEADLINLICLRYGVQAKDVSVAPHCVKNSKGGGDYVSVSVSIKNYNLLNPHPVPEPPPIPKQLEIKL